MAPYKFYNLDKNEYTFPINGDKTFEESLSSGEEIILTVQTQTYSKQTIENLTTFINKINKSNVKIKSLSIKYPKSYLYEKEDFENLKEINTFCKKNGFDLRVELNDSESEVTGGEGSFDQFAIARQKIEDFVEKINNLRIEENGIETPLSTAEKFLLVYRFASNRKYLASEAFGSSDMRNWIGLLSTDYAICSGYHSLLKCLCDRVFGEEEIKCFSQGSVIYNKENEELGNHANSLIYIKDDKYGINNVFYCDSCWDSPKQNKSTNFEYILPFGEVAKMKKYNFKFRKENLIYDEFGANTEKNTFFNNRQDLLDDFLFSRIGMKTTKQIVEEYDIDGKLRSEEEEAKEQESIIHELINTKIEELQKDKDIALILELMSTKHLPDEFYEKYPKLQQFMDYLFNFKLDTPIDKNLFKDYNNFYQENKKRFDKAIDKDKDSDVKFFKPLSEIIRKAMFNNEYKYFNKYTAKKKHEKIIEEKLSQHRDEFLKKAKPMLHAKMLPEELLKRAFTAIQKMEGIEDENFVDKKLSERKSLLENDFHAEELEDELD